jgi:hypothetical protein
MERKKGPCERKKLRWREIKIKKRVKLKWD